MTPMRPPAAAFRLLSRRSSLWLPALAAAAALLALWPVLGNGFSSYDDPGNFLLNPHYRGFGWENLRWMFTTHLMGQYHPVMWLSAAADHALWGLDPRGYHLTSLLLHALTAALACRLFARLLALTAPGGGCAAALSAAAAAVLFAVHPLRAEPVAWASARHDVLSTPFYLATILLYLDAHAAAAPRRGPPDPRRRPRLLAAAWVCYALGLLTKATALGLPLVLLLLDGWPLKRLGDAAGRRRALAEKAPFALAAAAMAAAAVYAETRGSRLLSMAEHGPAERLAQASYGAVFYVLKTLWPAGLSPLDARPPSLPLFAWPYLPAAAAALAASAAAVLLRLRLPAAAVAWFAYLFLLAPVSGLFTPGPQLVAHRYAYMTTLPLFALAAGGLRALRRARPAAFVPALALCAGLAAGWGGLARGQARLWGDDERFWRLAWERNPADTLSQSNLALTLYNRGVARAAAGRLAEAEAAYREALAVYPGLWQARLNLGNLLLRRGLAAEAAVQYRLALQASPGEPAAVRALEAALGGR